MHEHVPQYLKTSYVLPAVAVTGAIVLLVVLLLYGRQIFSWLGNRLRQGGGDHEPESVSSMLDASKRPISAIPVISEAVSNMAEGGKLNAIHMINYLAAQCLNLGASDLHFNPSEEGMMLSVRIEGMLYDVARLPREAYDSLLRRIKVMASLDVYKREAPQDGRITIEASGSVDIRVSIVPTIHGEKCVFRFFTTPYRLLSLENLGFSPETLSKYYEMCYRPQGTIFLTGPTGSGKTITAYATLNAVKNRKSGKVNIVSIEDPVEFDLPFLNQTQVNEKTGLTFAAGLRSLLRQDPNVIMIGEIRDKDTAEIAMQAGLTGHLIISSVHAESTAGVFARLMNMGIEPFILASASSGVLAQRLVRKLCPHCLEETPATPAQLKKLEEHGIVPPEDERTFMTSRGCSKCLDMGFSGRTGIFELLAVDEEIQEAIISKASSPKIYTMALRKGMRPLVREGLDQARRGIVSLDEVLAVV